MVVALNPCGVLLHVVAGHVVVHRHVWLVGHIEVAETLGQQRIQCDNRIVLDDFEPCLIEIGHVLGRHRAPLVADFLGLNTRGFHRVSILLGIGVGHLVQIEHVREILLGFLRDAFWIAAGHTGDHLQLHAAAFDGVAADNRPGGDCKRDAAMNQHGGDKQSHDVGCPTTAVGDERQHDL